MLVFRMVRQRLGAPKGLGLGLGLGSSRPLGFRPPPLGPSTRGSVESE